MVLRNRVAAHNQLMGRLQNIVQHFIRERIVGGLNVLNGHGAEHQPGGQVAGTRVIFNAVALDHAIADLAVQEDGTILVFMDAVIDQCKAGVLPITQRPLRETLLTSRSAR